METGIVLPALPCRFGAPFPIRRRRLSRTAFRPNRMSRTASPVVVSDFAETPALMRRVDALFLKYPFYGARQMVRHLRREWCGSGGAGPLA